MRLPRKDLLTYIKNNTTVLTSHVLIYLAPILITPVIIKSSGSELYGNYVIILTLCTLLVGISSFGIGFKARRFLPSTKVKSEIKQLFYMQFFIHLLLALLLALFAVWIFPYILNSLLDDSEIFNPFIIVPFLLVSVIHSQLTDYYRYTHRMMWFNASTVARPYLFIIVALAGYYYYGEFTVNNLFLSQIVGLSVIVLLLLPFVLKEIGVKIYRYKADQLTADLKLGFPIVLVVVFDHILGLSDRYVIANYMSTTDVAFYSVAYTIGMLPIFVAKVAGVILPPMMSRLVDQDNKQAADRLQTISISIFIAVAIPFFFGTIVLGEQVLVLYANKDTAENASTVMSIISFSAIIYGTVLININTLLVEMKTRFILFLNMVGGTVNLLLNVIFYSMIKDIHVAALTTLTSFIVIAIVIRKKTTNYDYCSSKSLIRFVGSVMLSSFLMSLGGWYIETNYFLEKEGVQSVFILILLSMMIYVFVLSLLNVSKYREFMNEIRITSIMS